MSIVSGEGRWRPAADAAGERGPVVVDLRSTQSPHFRDRGIARHAKGLALALHRRHENLVGQFLIDADLPPPGDLAPLVGTMTTRPRWPAGPCVLHFVSPYELDYVADRMWPRPGRAASVVVTVHDVVPEVFPEVYLQDPGLRARYRARHSLVRAADHVLTPSASAASDIVARLGVPEKRVTVVGAGCEAHFRPPRDLAAALEAARAAVPGLEERYVVYNGGVEPRKNMERLVEAFACLPEGLRTAWQLVLVCGMKPLEVRHFGHMARQLGMGDRLLLTGFVPDETLVLLYQAAGLVVFPSLYEGYGLPVAEALSCGAPVVASDTSSLVELVPGECRFDPTDVGAMTAALSRALSDPAMRSRMRDRAATFSASWDDVADRAASVYEEVLGRWRRSPPSGRRKKIALVTPWPPARSGVAAYSRSLAGALRRHVDVDVFAEGETGEEHRAEERGAVGAPPVMSAVALADVARLVDYDAVVHCMGNSEYHCQSLSRLLRDGRDAPCTAVLAHDVCLSGVFQHAAARGMLASTFPELVVRAYPGVASDSVPAWIDDGDAARLGILLTRMVVSRVDRFLTTSAFGARLAATDSSDALPDPGVRIASIGFGYAAPSPRRLDDVDPRLVCTFGLLHEVKQPFVLIEALAALADGGSDVHMAMVGPVSDHLAAALRARAEASGVGDRLEVTGRVDDARYRRYLDAAAVAVQLRRSTNGECSAAVADCLAHGIPTVVSDLGSFAELPADAVVHVPVEADGERLAAELASLLADAERRHALARRAHEVAGASSFEAAARRLLDALGLGGASSTGP